MAEEVLNRDNAWQCVQCMENQKTVVYLPCKHLAVCKSCDDQLKSDDDINISKSCLICSEQIDQRIDAFVQ